MTMTMMARIAEYMAGNHLQLNGAKSRIFLAGRKTMPTKVRIDGDEILTLQSINILGVRVSFNLKWNDHIARVRSSHTTRTSGGSLKSPPRTMARQFATAHVWSGATYAIMVYCSAPGYLMDKVKSSLNHTARITIGPTANSMATRDLMAQMGWATVQNATKAEASGTIRSIRATGVPAYLFATIKAAPNTTARSSWSQTLGGLDHAHTTFLKANFAPKDSLHECRNRMSASPRRSLP
jgi:hypothetical protein